MMLTKNEYDDALSRNNVILQNTIDIIHEGNWVVLVYDRKLEF